MGALQSLLITVTICVIKKVNIRQDNRSKCLKVQKQKRHLTAMVDFQLTSDYHGTKFCLQDDDISARNEVSCDMCDHSNIFLTLTLITFTMGKHISEIKTRKINARGVSYSFTA